MEGVRRLLRSMRRVRCVLCADSPWCYPNYPICERKRARRERGRSCTGVSGGVAASMTISLQACCRPATTFPAVADR